MQRPLPNQLTREEQTLICSPKTISTKKKKKINATQELKTPMNSIARRFNFFYGRMTDSDHYSTMIKAPELLLRLLGCASSCKGKPCVRSRWVLAMEYDWRFPSTKTYLSDTKRRCERPTHSNPHRNQESIPEINSSSGIIGKRGPEQMMLLLL